MSGTWSRKRRSAQACSVPAPLARTPLAPNNSTTMAPFGASASIHLHDHLPLPPAIQQQQLLLSRSTEKMFEEAELSGVLSLAGRKLKEFPEQMGEKYDISDTVSADLSSNRLMDIPASVCELRSLESLRMRQNGLRRIPSGIGMLDALTFLDLSNNHLSSLPLSLFELPLEILLLTGNRFESIPREIRQLSSTLTELDLSHNLLKTIPADIALLKMLRILILRKNLLDQFPSELCRLSLHSLDLSSNQFTQLPLHIRKMKTLVHLLIQDNPLQSPPANIVNKGREHVFKWMDVASGGGQQSSALHPSHHSTSTLRALNLGIGKGLVTCDERDAVRKSSAPVERRPRTSRFHTVGGSDSGYGSITADEHRLSNELVPSSLDDITEYPPVLSPPSPDEGIIVAGTAGSSCESVSLKSHESGESATASTSSSTSSSDSSKEEELKGGKGGQRSSSVKETTPVVTKSAVIPTSRGAVPLAEPEDTGTPKQQGKTSSGGKATSGVTSSRSTGQPSAISSTALIGNGNKVAPVIVKPLMNPLDLSNNNTVKAKDAYVNGARPAHAPPAVPTSTSTSSTTKPVSKVAPLVNTTRATTAAKSVSNNSTKSQAPPTSKLAAPVSRVPSTRTTAVNKGTSSDGSKTATGTSNGNRKAQIPVVNTAAAPKSRVPPSASSSIRPAVSSLSLQQRTARVDSSKASTPSSETKNDAVNGNVSLLRKSAAASSRMSSSTSAATSSTSSSTSTITDSSSSAVTSSTSIQGGGAIEGLRRIFNERLGITLPSSRDSLSASLSDGVHLCGLVNALRQRAITSIMTPTGNYGTQPLSPMKAKRNVDAFVAACKRVGVPDSSLCSSSDILSRRNLPSLYKTVSYLNRLAPAQKTSAMTVSMATARIVSHV